MKKQNTPKNPPEKATLKNPSLIRVKPENIILLKNFVCYALSMALLIN